MKITVYVMQEKPKQAICPDTGFVLSGPPKAEPIGPFAVEDYTCENGELSCCINGIWHTAKMNVVHVEESE